MLHIGKDVGGSFRRDQYVVTVVSRTHVVGEIVGVPCRSLSDPRIVRQRDLRILRISQTMVILGGYDLHIVLRGCQYTVLSLGMNESQEDPNGYVQRKENEES